MKAWFQTQGLSITLYQLTYNWLAYNFTELRCQQKIQAFTAFLHSLVYWRKRRPWTKKGTHIQKKVPRRNQISWRGPIWEQCKCWKPFLGVYLQLSSLLSRLWSEGGTGQDGGTRPKFLQGKICHCFVSFLWLFPNFFASNAPNAPNGGLSMSKQITCPLPSTDNSNFLESILLIWGQKGSNEENENFQRSISQLFWCDESKKLRGQSWNVW